MKKIFNQLCKLYPDTTIVIKHEIATYYHDYERYAVCILNANLYPNDWSPTVSTLKQLDTELARIVPNYKPIYK